MATNKDLKSKNKILQSLDLSANSLLNVSKIAGNEYGTDIRTRDLEISTRDTDSGNAGDLLLRAGTASGTAASGIIKVFAGANEYDTAASKLTLTPDGTATLDERSQIEIKTTGSASGSNSIVLTDSGKKLEIQNTQTSITGTDQIQIQNSADNQITLSATGNSLTVQNAQESHTNTGKFQINVPKDLGVSSDASDSQVTITADDGDNTTLEVTSRSAFLDLSTLQLEEDTKVETVFGSSEVEVKGNSTYTFGQNGDNKKTFVLQDTSKANTITLAEKDEKLTVDNSIAVLNSDTQLTLQTQDTVGASPTNYIQLTKIDPKIEIKSRETKNGVAAGEVIVNTPKLTENVDAKSSIIENGLSTTAETITELGKTSVLIAQGSSTSPVSNNANTISLENDGLTIENNTESHISETSNTITAPTITAQTDSSNPSQQLIIRSTADADITSAKAGIYAKANNILASGVNAVKLETNSTNGYVLLEKAGTAASPQHNLEIKNTKTSVTTDTEIHNVASEFKLGVPNTTGTTGTLLAITQADNKTVLNTGTLNSTVTNDSTQTITGSSTYTVGKDQSEEAFTIDVSSGTGSSKIANTVKFDQSANSLVIENQKTKLSTQNTTVDSPTTEITSADLTVQSTNQSTASFKLTTKASGQDDSVLRVNTLNVNKAVNLGRTSTGDTTAANGLDSIPVKASLSEVNAKIGTSLAIQGSNPAPVTANFKLGFPVVNSESTANTQALAEIDNAHITKRAYISNLDIDGDIRIGQFTLADAKVSSGTSELTFSQFIKNESAVSQASAQKIEIKSGSLSIDLARTLDIDTDQAITIDSDSKIQIGIKDDRPVTVNASQLKLTGNTETRSDTLYLESESTEYPHTGDTVPAKSFIKTETLQVTDSLYGNNVHMYWDDNTNSLVFARVSG